MMERDKKCILCETVHASRQEMDEHMRSMLHHRELEKLKGRDCGHECRVCKMTVVSLTEYAGHISSTQHKQNVEAAEQRSARPGCGEDYFDQVLVDLIEKRKETIRKEKEAADAKLAREEEERRRKEEFQQRLQEAKEQYQLDSVAWKRHQPAVSATSWYRGYRYSGREEEREVQPWHGKSATWHAQEPPNFQRWGSAEFLGSNMQRQKGWGRRQWDQGPPFSNHARSRLPWLSNGGSSNGVYSRNRYPAHQGSHKGSQQDPQHGSQRGGRPLSRGGPRSHMFKSAPSFFGPPYHQFDKGGHGQDHSQGHGFQSRDRVMADQDQGCNKNSKVHGGQDHRWSPYPVAKAAESHSDLHHNSQEKHPRVLSASSLKKDTTSDTRPLRAPPLPPSPPPDTRGTQVPKIRSRPRGPISSSSQHRDKISAKSSTHKSLLQKDLRMCPDLSSGEGNTTSASSTPPLKQCGFGPLPPLGGQAPSKQERPLPEKQVVSERRRATLDSPSIQKAKTTSLTSGLIGVGKKNTTTAKLEEPAGKPVDSSPSLQSLQVSTSMMENAEAAASGREEEATEAPRATGVSGTNSESDTCRNTEATQQQQQQASGLSLLDLPPVLKRDLTKHISSKSKAGGHEPNLNIARRVRNVGELRRSDSEKDSGLRPTVRQLISSSGSRRNVNWEQVYQEVKKRQDKGKGMPRFGIEMVPVDQEDQSQEEDNDIPLLEGFHWDLLMDSAASTTPRKRSLSESSLARSSAHSAFPSLISVDAPPSGASLPDGKPEGSSVCRIKYVQQEAELGEAVEEKQIGKVVTAAAGLQWSDSLVADSESGSEQPDGQGTGKRRRTVRAVPSAETSCSEQNSKRQKVKSKNERQQIDQLLAVSLREEELSGSLQSVEASLIQARATLEAAYLEVQRLSVVKQQMTADMNALRNKRIEILKGMQGSREDVTQLSLSVKTETTTSAAPPAGPPPPCTAISPSPAEQRASPPSSSLPLGSVTVKQEPQSPVRIKSEPDFADGTSVCAHSTTPDLQGTVGTAATASPSGPVLHSQELLELQQTEPTWQDCSDSADWREKHPEAPETSKKCVQANQYVPISVKLSPSRRESHLGVAATFEPMAPPMAEVRGGKRIRKLKKRKLLKKAQGADAPESSDTELDGEALKPRWLRARRRPSDGSQLSTSSSPPSEERSSNAEKATPEQKRFLRHSVTRPLVASTAQPTTNLDSDENMEVCCQSDTDSLLPQDPAALESFSPQQQQQQQQSLGCNEVTSTSDMDICKSSESDVQGSIILCTAPPKTSSDVSSDHRDDDLPSEGAFEGHQEAVNAVQIHDGLLYTCSGDRTVRAFDLVSHKCVFVFEGHSSKVSCLLVSVAPGLHQRLYSGSSDQTIRCYSLKTRELEQQFSLPDRVLCLISRWKTLFAGLANGTVVTFNLKTNKQMDMFDCHAPRAVSCLASSQEGARRLLLTGSFDTTISVRDAKSGLLLRTLLGHAKTVLCMNVVNDLVFSGSSDHCIYVHNIHTGELVRVYKGHSHAVTVVNVLGKVMVTACLDKLVRVYDVQSHEQLQVYGGHKDMVMCMAVHRSMIYTGCYDGSVQAVKLDLLQNFRCWWQGCFLVFGQQEHLQHHLVANHGGTSVQTPTKCRWRGCEEVFCTRATSKQAMLAHLQKHSEEANQLEP